MLDIGWTELVVIAVVLIVVVGPKDLPPMLRAFGKMTTRLRKTAGEFRAQFDEALREAEMDDVRKTISDVRNMNPANSLRDAINPLRQMGQEIKADLQKATAIEPARPTPADAAEDLVEMDSPFPDPLDALADLPPDLAPAATPAATAAPAATATASASAVATPAPAPTPAAAAAPAPVMADPAPAKPAPKKAAPKKAAAKAAEPAAAEKPKRATAKKAAAGATEVAAAAPKKATAAKKTPARKKDSP